MSHYLMCPPTYFDVVSTLNPWMDPSRPVDRDLALSQWHDLVDTYIQLGHTVETIEPDPGEVDMVFSANAGLVIENKVLAAVMATPERRGEERLYREWFDAAGFDQVHIPRHVNEGEGDFLYTGKVLLAGTGFRTDPQAHAEAACFFDVETITLQLVDPRWYHLDTALFVHTPDVVVWYPGAFSKESQKTLKRRFPDGILADATDALAFGLNSTSDGNRIVMPTDAIALAGKLRGHGIGVTTVDFSETVKAGGSIKCCTLELRA